MKATRLLIFIYSNDHFPPVSKLGRFREFITVTAQLAKFCTISKRSWSLAVNATHIGQANTGLLAIVSDSRSGLEVHVVNSI